MKIGVNELKDLAGYTYHHTALTRGYLSRKEGSEYSEVYKGRYGEGYKVHVPYYLSTRYHTIVYYIKEED